MIIRVPWLTASIGKSTPVKAELIDMCRLQPIILLQTLQFTPGFAPFGDEVRTTSVLERIDDTRPL
jgi:hypothetical protein